MIKTFKWKETERIFNGQFSHRLPQGIQRAAARKAAATQLESLRIPPGNQLEKVSGERSGQYSIRINQQWRICFVWQDGDAYDVEIVDYH